MDTPLPKVLLHEHLDGGLRVGTVIDLAAQEDVTLPAEGPEALAAWFDQGESGSLARYLEAFDHTVAVMQSAQALERVAFEAVEDLAADGVVYCEFRFAPAKHTRGSLDLSSTVGAVAAGLERGSRQTGMETGIILVAMRNEEDSEPIARLAVEQTHRGVVGFDLAGPEVGFPPDDHLPACRIAREANLGLTIHAGEAAGPRSIWAALQRCGAHRIGHGIAIAEDCRWEAGEIVELGPLARYVRDFGVPLEVCPTSNLHTKGWEPAAHPLGGLLRAGFAITLNTDNRLMSHTTMSREFELARDVHGLGLDDMMLATERAMNAAFAPLEVRRRLLEMTIRPAYRAASSSGIGVGGRQGA